MNQEYPNNRIVDIDSNKHKSTGDLRKAIITQTTQIREVIYSSDIFPKNRNDVTSEQEKHLIFCT